MLDTEKPTETRKQKVVVRKLAVKWSNQHRHVALSTSAVPGTTERCQDRHRDQPGRRREDMLSGEGK